MGVAFINVCDIFQLPVEDGLEGRFDDYHICLGKNTYARCRVPCSFLLHKRISSLSVILAA